MALKIRLARGGAKKRPFYRIVVAEASAPRDGRYVERVGTYNPMVPKDHEQRLTLNGERISFWMSKGAQPTERVHKMLASAGLMAAPVLRDQPKKSAPGKKRAEREAAAAETAKAAAEAAEAPADAPAEDMPAEETSAAAPAAEAVAEEVAADAPAEDAPAEETSAAAPSAEVVAEEVAADAPAEDAPAEGEKAES